MTPGASCDHPCCSPVALAEPGSAKRDPGVCVTMCKVRGDGATPIKHVHLLPRDHPERDPVLEYGALVTAVELPVMPSYLKCARPRLEPAGRSDHSSVRAGANASGPCSTVNPGGRGRLRWRCKR